ncbi:hypothetical protein [Myxococcus fulvus]|nr:hypothetical protein [Myxococcus fulvus]
MKSMTRTQRERLDETSMREEPLARTTFLAGGAGMIPPPGVLLGVQQRSQQLTQKFTHSKWAFLKGATQAPWCCISRVFYIYRENGKQPADYVVTRVLQAIVSSGTPMKDENNVRGYFPYELSMECTHNRQVALIGSSPDSTLGSQTHTQFSIPLQIKYLSEGSCLPQTWSATYGPESHSIPDWGVMNQSTTSAGKAAWRYFHRAPWDIREDPPSDYQRWWRKMYDGESSSGRVKRLNLLARSTVNLGNVATWRFDANVIATNPSVTFNEKLTLRLAAFANTKAPLSDHDMDTRDMEFKPDAVQLNLVQETEDVTSPCL